MPQTLNGVGTWYWGKSNIYLTMGTCESCGAFAKLSSYDTILFFVVVFVPIFPLQRLRILNQCSSCSQHRYLKRRDWLRSKTQDMAQVAAALEKKPQDPEVIQGFLGTLIAYQDRTAFLATAENVRLLASRQPETLRLLGHAYRYFDMWTEAERVYRDALRIDPSEETSEALATTLAFQLKAAEARPLLQHVLEAKDAEKLSLISLLIDSAQAAGDHGTALGVIEDTHEAFPDVKEAGHLTDAQRASEGRLESGKPIRSPLFDSPPPEQETPLGGLLPVLVGPVLIACLAALYFGSAFVIGSSRTLYVVNGLGQPYSVSINGERVELDADDYPAIIHVPEGQVSIAPVEGSLPVPAERLRLETDFWSRPFSRTTFVLNPDRTALVLWEQSVYSEGGGAVGAAPKVHSGGSLYTFEDLDYEFEEFPASLSIREHSTVKKERVTQWLLEPSQACGAINEYGGKQAVVDYLKALLRVYPDHVFGLRLLQTQLEREAFIAYLRPGLAVRPLRIETHRVYQDALKEVGGDASLVPEYRRLFEEVGDATSAYLLGRVVEDEQEAERLFLHGEDPSPYGLNAVGYARVASGRFQEGLELSQRALESGDNPSFRANEEMALLALRKLDALLRRNDAQRLAQPWSTASAVYGIQLHMLGGDEVAARAVAKEHQAWVSKNAPRENASVKSAVDATFAYAKGDGAIYQQKIVECDRLAGAFMAAVDRQDAEAAQKALGAGAEFHPVFRLLVYVLAARAGNEELEKRSLQDARNQLSGLQHDYRLVAQTLGGEAVDPSRLLALALDPQHKSIILVALGQASPEHRSRYFELAGKLNFQPGFPRNTLKAILASK